MGLKQPLRHPAARPDAGVRDAGGLGLIAIIPDGPVSRKPGPPGCDIRNSAAGRREDAERAKADLIAKNGEQVLEIWFNTGEVFARTNEQDMEREGFRKLGLRICATEEELKKLDNPKRLPECVKT
jgi:hypothetical protein